MAVTHFVTQFAHVFRHLRVKNRKREKNLRDICFEKVVSDLWEKSLCVRKSDFIKKFKN